MSDIVERLRDKNKNFTAFELDNIQAANEIESLRKRVEELEAEIKDWDSVAHDLSIKASNLEAELAALKQAQGEPVAWIDDEGTINFKHNWLAKRGTEFYLHSAPTIPEGWQQDAERYRWLRDHCTDMENPSHTWILESPGDLWDDAVDNAMLAAAPKPGGLK